MALIGRFIEQILPVGSITIVQADGGRETYGPGGGKHVAVRLHDRRAALELFRRRASNSANFTWMAGSRSKTAPSSISWS